MDATAGVFTTYKLQALLDCAVADDVASRRDLVEALKRHGQSISIHGVEAWFRHVDSNYNLPRESLCDSHHSYPIPKRRWPALLATFELDLAHLDQADDAFRAWCFARRRAGDELTAQAPKLVGRAADLDDLLAFHRRLQEGEGATAALAVVRGAAGIGKSAFLSVAAKALEQEGALVLRCACVERADTALQPVLDMVDAHQHAMGRAHEGAAAEISNLLRVEETAAGLRNGLLARLRRAFLELAAGRNVAFVIDDAHWADEFSTRLFVQLSRARPARGGRIFVAMAARPDTAESPWAEALRSAASNAWLLHLGPLDRAASATLVENVLETTCHDAFMHWLWSRTMGNPFYLRQMLEHLSRSGQLDAMRTPQHINVPQSMATTIDAQLQRLSAPARQQLGLASVFGATFQVADLQYAQERATTRAVVDNLEEAERMGLIVYDRDRFRFAHPLIRETLYDNLARSRRAYLHFAISQRLIGHETTRLRVLEVANHMLRGRLFAGEEALANACVEASRVAFQIEAWDQVVRFAHAALDVDRDGLLGADTRREMERHAGSGLHQRGNPAQAIHHLRRAAGAYAKAGEMVEAVRATNEVCRISTNYGIGGPRADQDAALLRQALPVIRNANPRLAGWTLVTLAMRGRAVGNTTQAERAVEEGLALLEPGEPCKELAIALLSAGLLCLDQADPIQACRYFIRGEAAARSAADRGSVARNLQRLALAQYALGRFDELSATVDLLDAADADEPPTGEHTLVQSVELAMYVLQGRSEDAARTYADAWQTLEDTGYRSAAARLHGAYTASLALAGDYAAANEVVADAARWQDHTAPSPQRQGSALLRQRLALLIDDLERPSADPIPDHLLIREPRRPRYMPDLPTIAVGLELSIRRRQLEQIRHTMDFIAEAFRRGTAVVAGWPSICALQLARATLALGDRDGARGYLPVAYDLIRQARVARFLDQTVALAQELGVSLPGEPR